MGVVHVYSINHSRNQFLEQSPHEMIDSITIGFLIAILTVGS